ncbi:hypothetical protein Prudu_022176 [Prunus dulcis]|uniref:Uncharacterized protein n=1 Tax=Prunus dulcis TaxID=3755 RepID=A0A4Y1S0S7_PRUDU|nr:hypothetical protein Prudu_022176 [Prunus dulcis]
MSRCSRRKTHFAFEMKRELCVGDFRKCERQTRRFSKCSAIKAITKRLNGNRGDSQAVYGNQGSNTRRAVFAAEDEDGPTEAVTIACPSKTVQFVNHMILGSQMELPEVDELPKKLLREQAGRAFRLQAAASMEMWLCVKRAISAAEKAKRAYDDGRAKVAEAGKAIQATPSY